MTGLSGVSDADLLARMPALVLAERRSSAEVIEHLVEIDRRRLYLEQACRSLWSYCVERLGYGDDEAVKRVRVARAVRQFPRVLDELRAGTIHLSGLCVLAPYLTHDGGASLLEAARGESKRAIEQLIASRFPRPDVPDRVRQEPEQTALARVRSRDATDASEQVNGTASAARNVGADNAGAGDRASENHRPGTVNSAGRPSRGRVSSLSALRWAVQFTASTELRDKIERARELLSHAVPGGDLAVLFERALDALIERETKRRLGAGKPRKRRKLAPGSRHVPVEVARRVWERDGGQCTFVDESGRRCSSREFITIEHREPFARGGESTVENTCLLCWSHNEHAARRVFGEDHIQANRARREKTAERKKTAESGQKEAGRTAEVQREWETVRRKAHQALRSMGFREMQVRQALACTTEKEAAVGLERLIRQALGFLVRDGATSTASQSPP